MAAPSTMTIPVRNSATADPFDTEQIRARVLDAWRASPDRLREDANSEEDFALGGYRDRLVVELAQNAADAAHQRGVDCRILIRLSESELIFANTGAPIDAAGVGSLASMRASSKRGDGKAAGRFGVGFAAVLTVSDEPAAVSVGGGVRFSAVRTRSLVAAEDSLTEELQRRSGHVPVLRLPFPENTPPPDGYDTAVLLPFRDSNAQEIATAMVVAIDDALLLGLESISEIVIELGTGPRRVLRSERTGGIVQIADGEDVTRWRVLSAAGQLDAGLLADRPTEERLRPRWSLTWAIPVDDGGQPRALPLRIPSVLHAPTPSAEPLSFDALLLASFPLDPARQHVPSGPLTDFLIARCAETYADLLVALADDIGYTALELVPPPRLVGAVDGRLREAIRAELRERPLLQSASTGALLSRERAVVLMDADQDVVEVLADVIDGLVAAEWSRSATAVTLLEPATISLADALDLLVDAQRPATWWYSLYVALDAVDRTQLDGLPVPLADGRVVRDVRSCVLPATHSKLLTSLGLRVIHPDAGHPLLARLGARSSEPRVVLADPQLHERLCEALPTMERDRLSRSILTLVREAALGPGEEPALGQLAVPLDDGVWVDVRGAVLPSTLLASVVTRDIRLIDAAFVSDVGAESLIAVGALGGLSVEHHHDVLLDPDSVEELVPDGGEWAEHLGSLAATDEIDSAIAVDVALVVGLDLVAEDAWGRAWPLLAEPDVRRAIVEPVGVVLGSGVRLRLPSFAAWWLSDAPLFGTFTPSEARLPGDDRLAGLFEPVPILGEALDLGLLGAIGVCASVEELLSRTQGANDLLDRMADTHHVMTASEVQGLYRALADSPLESWPDPPERLRVIDGADTRVVPAAEAVVVVAPHHAPLARRGFIVGPPQLAEMLEIATTSELAARVDLVSVMERDVPVVVRSLVANAPERYFEHDDIVCADQSVEWWVDDNGGVHAATMDGLARGVAWATGNWSLRWELAAILGEPDRLKEALSERAFD
jgi:hypothetical protein